MITEYIIILWRRRNLKTKILSKNEKFIKELEVESGWRCVRHGNKIGYYKNEELLRKPVLTNKRLILLNGEKIDYEIPIGTIERVESVDTENPYLKIILKNGEAFPLDFIFFPPSWWYGYKVGDLYLLDETKSKVDQWKQSINNLIKK
jgi:hypothetical protein